MIVAILSVWRTPPHLIILLLVIRLTEQMVKVMYVFLYSWKMIDETGGRVRS